MIKAKNGQTYGALLAGLAILALFYFAQSVIVPMVFALFIIALVWPLQAFLQKRLPQLLALFITLSLTILVFVCVGYAIAWGFSKLGEWLFVNGNRFQAIYVDWTNWLEERGIDLVGPINDRFDVAWLVGFSQRIAGRLNSMAGFAILIFIFVMLGLLEVEDFIRRLKSPATQPYGQRMLTANREIGRKLRRFMLVRSFASLLTGLVVWGFASVAGLELAAAWGAIAFALNYIPFIGPLIATAFPTLFAMAQFDSWQMVVAVFACLNLIQFLIGSYMEPRLTGASLAISPLAVIFMIFFWSFMWGISGAFIGVPMLIVFITYCSHSEQARWIAALLSSGKSLSIPDEQSGH